MARGRWMLRRQLSDRQFLVNTSTAFSQQSTHVSRLQLRECHPDSIGYTLSPPAFRVHEPCIIRFGAFSKLTTPKESWPEHLLPP